MYKVTIRQGRSARAPQVKGAVAIEFAIIFSILFGLFYAIISYALPLMMMQAFHAAAADGARAAVRVIVDEEATEPCPESFKTEAASTAEEEARQRITWLDSLMTNVPEADRVQTSWSSESECLLQVTVQYPSYTDNPPIPVLTLPMIGDVPRLPDTLSGSASTRL